MEKIFRKRKIIYFKPYEKKIGIWGMAKQLSMGWGHSLQLSLPSKFYVKSLLKKIGGKKSIVLAIFHLSLFSHYVHLFCFLCLHTLTLI